MSALPPTPTHSFSCAPPGQVTGHLQGPVPTRRAGEAAGPRKTGTGGPDNPLPARTLSHLRPRAQAFTTLVPRLPGLGLQAVAEPRRGPGSDSCGRGLIRGRGLAPVGGAEPRLGPGSGSGGRGLTRGRDLLSGGGARPRWNLPHGAGIVHPARPEREPEPEPEPGTGSPYPWPGPHAAPRAGDCSCHCCASSSRAPPPSSLPPLSATTPKPMPRSGTGATTVTRTTNFTFATQVSAGQGAGSKDPKVRGVSGVSTPGGQHSLSEKKVPQIHNDSLSLVSAVSGHCAGGCTCIIFLSPRRGQGWGNPGSRRLVGCLRFGVPE